VTDVGGLTVTAEVDETDVLLVAAGQSATVELDAVPGASYDATVTAVDLTPSASTGGGVVYRVRLALAGGTPRRRPRAQPPARHERDRGPAGPYGAVVLAVPSAAVVRDGGEDAVFVVEDGRVAARRGQPRGAGRRPGRGPPRPVRRRAGGGARRRPADRRAGGRDVADVTRAAGATPALEAVDVTRSYALEGGTVQALRGVSLTVEQGDYAAVVGPSGSGKSTLMHLLGGLDRPTTGVLRVGGRDIATLSEDELAQVRNATIGFVFQAFQLLGRTSAVDNVAMPLVYRGAKRAERRKRAVLALERVGMGHRLDHRPAQLSGGEQQRVAIAGPWSVTRRCCWPTSPPATSTPAPARRSWPCWRSSTPSGAWPSCW
jgi:predicted ABC-type transport system involved in lysophospholipase L1 biosynthesis ATPase subunit